MDVKNNLLKAQKAGFPAFLHPIDKSNYENSSPYVIDGLDEFSNIFQSDHNRLKLIKNLKLLVSHLTEKIGKPVVAMIGGSFLQQSKPNPKDLDVLIYYIRKSESPVIDDKTIPNFFRHANRLGIDAQLFPYDYSPLYVLKICSFYTNLFSSTRQTGKPNGKGVIIVNLQDKH